MAALLADGPVIHYAASPAENAPLAFVSGNIERRTGRPADELVAGVASWAELIHPDDRARYAASLAGLRRSGAAEIEYRLGMPEAGGWVRDTMRLVGGPDGRLLGTVVDIAREKQAAAADRDGLARVLRESIDNLPAGFTITGPDDRIVICNEAYAQSMGRPAAALIGLTRSELIERGMHKLRSVDGQPFQATPEGMARVKDRLCRPNGKPVELELASGETLMIGSSVLANGSVVCVRTDVTEIRRAERAIRESSDVIHRMLDACPIPIAMTRADDGLVIYESPASRALYGRDPVAEPVYACDSFVDRRDRDRYLRLLRASGGVDGFEARMRRSDGRQFWAALSGRLIEFQGQEVIVGSSFDLSERHAVDAEMARQRDALHRSEKLAALGELLAGVAHELNNPLSVVVGQALLLTETADDPAIADRVAKIGRAADRCVRIVKTFLAMARRRPRRSEPVDLNHLVQEAVEVTRHALRASGIELTLRLAPSLPPVEGDPDQLAQVLTNLVLNAEMALREMPDGRRLTIATSVRGRRRQVVLTVRDNGPGVAAEHRSRIFEPFFTTREVGTGIGLAFCHRVIEAHGGSIRIDEVEGPGASFSIALPLAASCGAAAAAAPPGCRAAGKRRILVIDDEAEVADVIAAMLRERGEHVEIALSGGEALSRLRLERFDAVVSDLRMPGLDGERLFGVLSRERPELVPRLGFITGDAMGTKAQRFLERCGRPYLEKPFTPADAVRLVDAIVAGRALADAR